MGVLINNECKIKICKQATAPGGWKNYEDVQIGTEYKEFQMLLLYILHNDMFDPFSC